MISAFNFKLLIYTHNNETFFSGKLNNSCSNIFRIMALCKMMKNRIFHVFFVITLQWLELSTSDFLDILATVRNNLLHTKYKDHLSQICLIKHEKNYIRMWIEMKAIHSTGSSYIVHESPWTNMLNIYIHVVTHFTVWLFQMASPSTCYHSGPLSHPVSMSSFHCDQCMHCWVICPWT